MNGVEFSQGGLKIGCGSKRVRGVFCYVIIGEEFRLERYLRELEFSVRSLLHYTEGWSQKYGLLLLVDFPLLDSLSERFGEPLDPRIDIISIDSDALIEDAFGTGAHGLGAFKEIFSLKCRIRNWYNGFRLFREEFLRGYDVLWRMEPDAIMRSHILEDVFLEFERFKAVYGVVTELGEISVQEELIEGFWESIADYSKSSPCWRKKRKKYEKSGAWNREVYYGGCELLDLGWWRGNLSGGVLSHLSDIRGVLDSGWPLEALRAAVILYEGAEERVMLIEGFDFYSGGFSILAEGRRVNCR